MAIWTVHKINCHVYDRLNYRVTAAQPLQSPIPPTLTTPKFGPYIQPPNIWIGVVIILYEMYKLHIHSCTIFGNKDGETEKVGCLSLGLKWPGREAHHSPPVPRSRMRGVILPIPQYAFMVWRSVKEQGQLYI